MCRGGGGGSCSCSGRVDIYLELINDDKYSRGSTYTARRYSVLKAGKKETCTHICEASACPPSKSSSRHHDVWASRLNLRRLELGVTDSERW